MIIISVWNEFLFALTFTATSTGWIITVIITLINGTVEYEVQCGIVMVASVIVIVPLVINTTSSGQDNVSINCRKYKLINLL